MYQDVYPGLIQGILLGERNRRYLFSVRILMTTLFIVISHLSINFNIGNYLNVLIRLANYTFYCHQFAIRLSAFAA